MVRQFDRKEEMRACPSDVECFVQRTTSDQGLAGKLRRSARSIDQRPGGCLRPTIRDNVSWSSSPWHGSTDLFFPMIFQHCPALAVSAVVAGDKRAAWRIGCAVENTLPSALWRILGAGHPCKRAWFPLLRSCGTQEGNSATGTELRRPRREPVGALRHLRGDPANGLGRKPAPPILSRTALQRDPAARPLSTTART